MSLQTSASPTRPVFAVFWRRSWFVWAGSKHLPSFMASWAPAAAGAGGEQESISWWRCELCKHRCLRKGILLPWNPLVHLGDTASGGKFPHTPIPGPRSAPWPPRELNTSWDEAISVGAQRAFASCKPNFLLLVNFIGRTRYPPLQEPPPCKGQI